MKIQPEHSTANSPRILLCINKYEHELFFGASQLPDSYVTRSVDCLSSKALAAEITDFKPDVLISSWSTPPLATDFLPLSSIKYICHLAGSVRALVPRSFIKNGGIVTNWGNLAAPQVAEHALLLALAALRNIKCWETYIGQDPETRGSSTHKLNTKTLYDRKVGIHGYGRVARQLVKLLAPFRTDLRVYSMGVPSEMYASDGIKESHSLEELFQHSEILFECEALTDKTRGTVSANILGRLEDGAIVINVGRGAIIDETALLREASSGRLHVGLDVIADEPLHSGSPWLKVPGAVLSPHMAGPTMDRYTPCSAHALANIARFFRGEPVVDRIDASLYDQMT